MKKACFTVTAGQIETLKAFYDEMMNLIQVDETHEWMAENEIFDEIQFLYERLDEVEKFIVYDEGDEITEAEKNQIDKLLEDYKLWFKA